MSLREIELLALDVDGVLTDGRIWLDPEGREIKAFDVRDGAALRWWLESGGKVALITGRSSPAVSARARELGIERVYLGVRDKRLAFDDLLESEGLQPHQVAYMGDDLPDLPVMLRAGHSFTVPEAPEEVRRRAGNVTVAPGGAGAVREVIIKLLEAHDLWQRLLHRFDPCFGPGGDGPRRGECKESDSGGERE